MTQSNAATIQLASGHIDLSGRILSTQTVAASPAAATETTIASLAISKDVALSAGIYVVGWAAYTVGTSGVSVNLRIRQTNTSGSVIAATGATTAVATNLGALSVWGLDTASGIPGSQTYVLTMTVASGSATSTVSGVNLLAILV